MPRISLPADARVLDVPSGATILESALLADVPITHACGGHARCSTCRVIVVEGAENLSARTPEEEEIARKRAFPCHVRLACQTRALGDVTLRRLVLDDEDYALVKDEIAGVSSGVVGEERRLAILFADVRDFTPFTASQSPYDVVHVLNRFFHRVEAAVRANGGFVDAYLGDGALCLFGVDGAPDVSGRAVRAALAVAADAKRVGEYVRTALGTPFRVGVGVHTGPAIVGVVGSGERKRLTAVGDSVNVASRVEAATKTAGADVLVSDDTFRDLGGRVRVGRRFDLPLKGKTGSHALYEVLSLSEPATATPAPRSP